MTAHNQDEFDDLLNHALSEYRDAEPLAGLEDRVLQRIVAGAETQRSRWWRWGAAVACAAVILVVAVIALRSRTAAPVQQATQGVGVQVPAAVAKSTEPPRIATQPLPASSPRSTSMRSARPTLAASVERKPHVALTPDQFPTPTPLTPEERALIALARTQPEMLFARLDGEHGVEIQLIEIKLLPESNVENEGDN